MKDYLRRMCEELDELDGRIERLSAYNRSEETGDGKFASLPIDAKVASLLQEQDMKHYRDILKVRIEMAEERGDGKD